MIKPILKPNAKIFLLGEMADEQEALTGIPFIGPLGQELTKLLEQAGISRINCSMSSVVLTYAEDFDQFCCSKKEVSKDYSFPRLKPGKYLKPEHLTNLTRLQEEIAFTKPNIIIALGATALWALTGLSAISKNRGTIIESTLVPGVKVLPTFHPSYILRQWESRPIVIADLAKAKRESEFPEIIRPEREIWIEPTLQDIQDFKIKYLDNSEFISYDIETARRQITCLSFSPDPFHSLVIPFVDKRKPGWSYWEEEEEIIAWNFVQEILSLPQPKIAHNGVYDIQYLWRVHGLSITNASEDTMLLQHSLQPELPKGLGFLGSIYTNESAWKNMREAKDTLEKSDDE